jgi:hypothetical protein
MGNPPCGFGDAFKLIAVGIEEIIKWKRDPSPFEKLLDVRRLGAKIIQRFPLLILSELFLLSFLLLAVTHGRIIGCATDLDNAEYPVFDGLDAQLRWDHRPGQRSANIAPPIRPACAFMPKPAQRSDRSPAPQRGQAGAFRIGS